MSITRKFLLQNGSIIKYIQVFKGRKRWNREYKACVDHEVIGSFYRFWRKSSGLNKYSLYPQVLEVDLLDDQLIDMNYSDDDGIYNSGDQYAESRALKILELIEDQESLFDLLLCKSENWVYSTIIYDDIKVLAGAVIYSLKEHVDIKFGLDKSERYFGVKLDYKEEFIASLENKKVFHASDYLKLGSGLFKINANK